MPVEIQEIKMLIVLVNYYNDEEIISFVRSELMTQLLNPIHVIVVNNGSHDLEILTKGLNDYNVTLMDPGNNLGYLHAFLYAANQFKFLNNYYPDLMILCNSDIYLRSNGLLRDLYLRYKNTDYACIGPSIMATRNATYQNPFMISRINKSKLQLLCFVDNYYPVYLLYQLISLIKSKLKKHRIQFAQNPVPGPVYALHGSFMVFSKLFISSSLNELNSAPFLFGEEIFIAEVARKHNMVLFYDSSLAIDHNEHATTGTFKTRKMIKYEKISLSQIIEQFFR